MPYVAVRLACIGGHKPDSSDLILTSSHRLQMRWVHAVADPAEMVELQARRDRTDERFIGHAMGLL